ncbi:MAG: PKD domain-containing protein, partial [Saprospiraceae bacterium]
SYTGPVSNAYSTNNPSSFVANLPAGTYNFAVSDGSGCSDTETITVGNSGLSLTVSQNPNLDGNCNSQGNPVVLNFTGGQGPYVVSYSGPQTNTISVGNSTTTVIYLSAGSYTFNIQDGAGCMAQQEFTVQQLSGLSLTTQLLTNDCGQDNGVRTTVAHGEPPYSYTVSNTCGTPVLTGTSLNDVFNLVGLANCNYTISVTGAGGCTATSSFIIATEAVSILTATPDAGTCSGLGGIILDISVEDGPYYISWTGPVNGDINLANTYHYIPNLPSGIYTISIVTDEGCTDEVTVTLNNSGDLDVILSPVAGDCGMVDQIWVDIEGGQGPFMVEVLRLCDSVMEMAFMTSTNGFEVFNPIPCVYKIIVTDANGCMAMQTVEIFPNNIFTAIATDGECGGNGSIDVTVFSGNPPYTITYTGPISGTLTQNSPTYQIANAPAGTYATKVTNGMGCMETETVTVQTNNGGIEIISALIVNECGQYNQIWNDVEGGTPPYTIEVITLCDDQSEQDTTFTLSDDFFELFDLPECKYKIKVTDANGCMDMDTVMVFPAPVDLFTGSGVGGACGELGQISLQFTGGMAPYTVTYSGPSSGSFTTNGPLYFINNLAGGTYTITVTDAQGCTEVETVTVTLVEGDLELISALITDECGVYNQIWNDIEGGTPPFTIELIRLCDTPSTVVTTVLTSERGFEFFDLPECKYKVKVTDNNGCMDMDTIMIMNGNVNLFTPTPQPGDCTQSGSIRIDIISGMPTYMITWSGPTSGTVALNGTTFTIPNLPAGTYTITVQTGNGCTETETVVLTAGSGGGIDIISAVINNNCNQFNQVWNDIEGGTPPFTIEVITLCDDQPEQDTTFVTSDIFFELFDLPECKYKIKVTDANGCMDMDTVMIFDQPVDNFDLTPMNGACNELGSIRVDILMGVPQYKITWSGPVSGMITTSSTTYTISNLPSGTYVVTVMGGNGCMETDTAVIENTVSDLELFSAVILNDCGQYNQIWNDIEGGTPPYTVQITSLCPENPFDSTMVTMDIGFDVANLPPCDYKIKVTDANGCMDMETITIYTSPVQLFDLSIVDGTCSMGSIVIELSAGNPPFQINLTRTGGTTQTFTINEDAPASMTFSDLLTGTYTVSVTSGDGCTQTENFSLEGMGFLVGYGTQGGCNGSTINGTITGMMGEYTISYTGPSTSSVTVEGTSFSLADLAPGTYVITVTNEMGCTNVQNITVQQSVAALLVQLQSTNGGCGSNGQFTTTINGGQAPYHITYSDDDGQLGSTIISETTFTVGDLPAGNYSVTVTDAQGCSRTLTTTITVETAGLAITAQVTPPGCGTTSSVALTVGGGQAPFIINYAGPTNGNLTSATATANISGLQAGTYTFGVQDAGGCQGSMTVTVTGTTTGPTAFFTTTIDDRTVLFTNQSTAGSYTWDFGDGAISTSNNPLHTYFEDGTYQVCLTVSTPACGTQTYCEQIVIETNDGLILDIGEATGAQNSVVNVPVYLLNADNLTSVAGSFTLSNPSVANIEGVAAGAILPQYNVATRTFSYVHNVAGGMPTNGQPLLLFYLKVRLTGAPASSSNIYLINFPVSVEISSSMGGTPTAMAHSLLAGSVVVGSESIVELDAMVQTYWGAGVEGTEVELNAAGGLGGEMVVTNGAGQGQFGPVIGGQMYHVSAHKDDEAANGLSTFGLYLGQRYLLGLPTPQITSPYQVIAGDANCSNTFTTLDLYLIQRVLLGTDPDFGTCPSWVFVHESNDFGSNFTINSVFPYISEAELMVTDNMTTSFTGVKVGDILGQANPTLFWQQESEDRNLRTLPFTAANQAVSEGEEVTVDLRAGDFADLASFQFQLAFPSDQLELVSIDGSLPGIQFNTARATSGLVRLAWFDPSGNGTDLRAANETGVLQLRFRARRAIADWQELLMIDSTGFPTEAYTADGEPVQPRLQWTGGITAGEAVSYLRLDQNQPNPFTNSTRIGFALPAAGPITLTVYDLLGRPVWTRDLNLSAGEHAVEWENENLAPGLYRYELRTATERASKSMLIGR